jgi:hypothetical protein
MYKKGRRMTTKQFLNCAFLLFLLAVEEGSCQRKKVNATNQGRRQGGLQIGGKRNSTIANSFNEKTSSSITEEPTPPSSSLPDKKTESVTKVIINGGATTTSNGKSETKEKVKLNVGLLVPYSTFYLRDYVRAVSNAISLLQRKDPGRGFYQRYNLTSEEVKMFMISVSPSPRGE